MIERASAMNYRYLGASSLQVSPICLGTMLFGSQTSEGEATRIVDFARASGVNFIDTADSYNMGETERIVGRLIAEDRHRWILATKVGNAMGTDPNLDGLGRRRIILAAEQSLKRLGTDWIDIYYLHRDDPDVPLEESLSAIAHLTAQGKILYFGVSNFRGWRVAEIVNLCDKMGINRPVCAQPYYNAVNRMPEVEYLPACQHYGIGVVPYSPLARGVLTGKYAPNGITPTNSRLARNDQRMLTTEFREESLHIAQLIKERAEQRGMTAGQFAYNWVVNHAQVAAAVAGPRTLEQWQENLSALDFKLNEDDESFIDQLVPPGHPSTHGYTDPKYPVTGRVARSTPIASA